MKKKITSKRLYTVGWLKFTRKEALPWDDGVAMMARGKTGRDVNL